MLNILIPMAGEGSRFRDAGYELPKPFIDVAGEPMISRVLENLRIPDANYILVVREEHRRLHSRKFDALARNFPIQVVEVNGLTEGTVCSVLHARKRINNDRPLMIANSDQFIAASIGDFYSDCVTRGLDGSILCFRDHLRDPKWSFAKVDAQGILQEVAEKKPISDLATVGIYLFAEGRIFVDAAIDMIARNDRVNREFYTCPVYNYAIKNGYKFGVFEIGGQQMHGLGTPDDLQTFLRTACQ
jgi:dTDP-glucose pyrophosphorylase